MSRSEWSWVGTGAALAVSGWVFRAPLLGVAGVLLAFTVVLLWVWGRESLTGVTYARVLDRRRAAFGEQVPLEVEIVNDKLLPLTWLLVREELSSALTIRGARVVRVGWREEMQFVLPLLPFQRVRRRLTLVCDQRGEHHFGPSELRSGSPTGSHQRSLELFDQASILVYPKVFTLGSARSRLPIALDKARTSLADDPVRIRGVREYRAGDPLRRVDWRATARTSNLLVRVHEPATTTRVALFVDVVPPSGLGRKRAADVIELTIAVAASIVSALTGLALGLYSNGTARGRPLAADPAAGPDRQRTLLELLAIVTPARTMPLGAVVLSQRALLRNGTSAIVVGSDFAPSTTAALGDLGRSTAVSAAWVSTTRGRPPRGVGTCWEVKYDDAWRERTSLE